MFMGAKVQNYTNSTKTTSEENKVFRHNNTEKMYFCALERAGK